jgi:serine/threonine protein phosphatase PrpC
MERVLASGKALPERLDELVQLALAAGGDDNITVVGLDLS